MKQYLKILIHIIVPIFLGTTVYAFWRGLYFIDPSEKYFPFYSANVPDWIKYNLPDGLWFYALLSSVTIIWNNSSKYYYIWLLSAIIFSYLTEIFQAFHFVPGTFDLNDLLAYTTAVIFYSINFQKINQPLFTIK